MAEITELSVQKKNQGRVNVYTDGHFLCGMELTTVIDNHLKVGQHIEIEQLSHIQFESEKQTAAEKAMTYAARCMKTERQVVNYLKDKGYMPEIVDYALAILKEYRYIDDAEYARTYLETSEGKGRNKIYYDLMQRGIARDIIEETLCALSEDVQIKACRAAAEKYVRGKVIDRKLTQKLFTHLRGKGFDTDIIKDAMAYLAESAEEEGF